MNERDIWLVLGGVWLALVCHWLSTRSEALGGNKPGEWQRGYDAANRAREMQGKWEAERQAAEDAFIAKLVKSLREDHP